MAVNWDKDNIVISSHMSAQQSVNQVAWHLFGGVFKCTLVWASQIEGKAKDEALSLYAFIGISVFVYAHQIGRLNTERFPLDYFNIIAQQIG